MIDKIDQYLTSVYIWLLIWLFGRRLPVYWGNNVWFEYKDFIFPFKEIRKRSRFWQDYSLLPNGATSYYSSEDYEHFKLREKLQKQILDGILDEIMAPKGRNPICIFTCGGTASGKTSAVDEMKLDGNFLRIDYDRIKKLIPEYPEMLKMKVKDAATYVQLESIKLGGKLFKAGKRNKLDLIYEKTLDDPIRAKEDIKTLRKKKYKIVVIATHVTKDVGLLRAEKRFNETGRFVPMDVVDKIYRGVAGSLFEIRGLVDDVYLFDNNGENLELVFKKSSTVCTVINSEAYQNYVDYHGPSFDLRL